MHHDKLRKLAQSIEALAGKDEKLIGQAREIAALRASAAAELHAICADFVGGLNHLLEKVRVDLDPAEFAPGQFREDGPNLFQVNVRGRILQLEFQATEELVSTEDFRVPYILEGSVRSFNQQLLEQDLIQEHLLFYCLERTRRLWRYFDERTYRTGPVDSDYLAHLMEQLV